LMTKRAWSRATSLASPACFTESSTASKSLQAPWAIRYPRRVTA
jgi:hypothetical protein